MSLLFEPKFPTGKVVITLGASEALKESGQNPIYFVERHTDLEKGNLSDEDYQENLESLEKGFRILSSFHTDLGEVIWVITEADRSVTTLLLPDEY